MQDLHDDNRDCDGDTTIEMVFIASAMILLYHLCTLL